MKRKITLSLFVIMFVSALFTGCVNDNGPSQNPGQSGINSENKTNNSESIVFEDYIKVNYSGYSGLGTITFDYTAINQKIKSKDVKEFLKQIPELDETQRNKYENFSDLIDVAPGKWIINGELFNGDYIGIYVDVCDELSNYISINMIQLAFNIDTTISNLVYLDGFEEFPELDITFIVEEIIGYAGGNGAAEVDVVFPEHEWWQINDLYLTKSNNYGSNYVSLSLVYKNQDMGRLELYYPTTCTLSEGDEIVIKVDETYVKRDLLKLGYNFISEVKLQVPDLGEHLSSEDQLTDELKQLMVEEIKKRYRVTKINHVYFGTLKPTAIVPCFERYQCCVLLDCESLLYGKGYSYKVLFEYFVIKPDGTYEFSSYAEPYTEMKERYIFVEIENFN